MVGCGSFRVRPFIGGLRKPHLPKHVWVNGGHWEWFPPNQAHIFIIVIIQPSHVGLHSTWSIYILMKNTHTGVIFHHPVFVIGLCLLFFFGHILSRLMFWYQSLGVIDPPPPKHPISLCSQHTPPKCFFKPLKWPPLHAFHAFSKLGFRVPSGVLKPTLS